MDTTSRNRWIASITREAAKELPFPPWSRAAKRFRRVERVTPAQNVSA